MADLIIEVLLEIYFELMFLIVPEKNVSKKHILVAKVIAVAVFVALAALFVWGMVLLVDYKNKLGVIPVAIAGVLSLAQIIAGIVLYRKHH